MAKENGIGMTISVDDSGGTVRAIGNDILSATIATPRALQDITGINSSARERLALLADASVGLNYVFNDASGASSFDVFKTVGSASPTSRTVTLAISGQTLAMEMLADGANWNRAADGSFTGSSNLLLQSGTAPTWA